MTIYKLSLSERWLFFRYRFLTKYGKKLCQWVDDKRSAYSQRMEKTFDKAQQYYEKNM